MSESLLHIKTFGELKASGYKPKSIKQELRDNLVAALANGSRLFEGILGFEDTVIPDLERAILSRHNILLLGLRGQAKTRIARQLTHLLDEYIPFVKGSEIHDDPFAPLSYFAKHEITIKGDDTEIDWLHRSVRYVEKLATPDVSVADLVGDIDPIKAASLKLPYSDERVIHYGLIPRSHRCIFVINELPDLQARIQVALFNILQEGDLQIRGFVMRLPLDIQFVFTANPEDYTNRGSIVTPLKDRIESQILTHYPKSLDTAVEITRQEARILQDQTERVVMHPMLAELLEQVVFEARKSEYVDSKSGVSARLGISAYENLVSTVERRVLINNEVQSDVRVSDLYGIIQAITGKIELVYEGETEGPANVARILIGKSVRAIFPVYYPSPDSKKKNKEKSPYAPIVQWFTTGNYIDLDFNADTLAFRKCLNQVPGLKMLVKKQYPELEEAEIYLHMELVLFALAEYSEISKHELDGGGLQFKDLLSSMFSRDDEEGGYYE